MTTLATLVFFGKRPELTQTVFSRAGQEPLVCVRGKTAGSFRSAGTFQWTAAVKGLCALFIRTRLAQLDQSIETSIEGTRGSLAASLDYAIVKQPSWILEMFGVDAKGKAYIRQIITRTNSQRKLPGPVKLTVDQLALRPTDIRLVWNDTLISSAEQLTSLLAQVVEGEIAQDATGVCEPVEEALAA